MTNPTYEASIDYYIDQLAAYRHGQRKSIVKDEAKQIEILLRLARGALIGGTFSTAEQAASGPSKTGETP